MISEETKKIFQEYTKFINAQLIKVGEHETAYLNSHSSRDLLLMVPGGSGQLCIATDHIERESLLIPANLPERFNSRGVSSCVFNSCVEIPQRYSPLLPITDDHDDVTIEKHYQQIKEIILYYRERYQRIWWIGHSSSATVAIGMAKWWEDFSNNLAGLILINPKKVFKRPGKKYVPHFGKWLEIPVLAVSHARDGSPNCPLDFNRMLSKCSKDTRSKHIIFNGGTPDGDNDPSLGFGYHGLRGLEHELVAEIIDFIGDPQVDR